MQHRLVRWFDRLRPRPAPATPFARGVVALDRGDAAGALREFDAALAAMAGDAERVATLNKRAIAHLTLGDRAAALDDLSAALSLDPRFVPAITNLGNLCCECGDLDEAVVHYEAALRIDDGYALAHRNLGIALRRLGKRAAAVREFRRADRLATRLGTRRPPAESP